MQRVKNIFAFLLLVLCCAPARATYGNSGKQDFATAASTICVPNSGGVTAGDTEVMAVQSNSVTAVTVASTRVTTWMLDQSDCCNHYLWHGVVTSSGAESITATLASGTAVIGSACAEYTAPFNETSSSGTINASAGSDVVAFASACCAAISTNAPFTQRQTINLGATPFAALADDNAGAGSYSPTFVNAGTSIIIAYLTPKRGAHSGLIRHRYRYPNRGPLLFARIAWRKEGAPMGKNPNARRSSNRLNL
jgi:hypothetical protein